MFYRKLLEFAQFLLLVNWVLGGSIVSHSERVKRLATPNFDADILSAQGKFVVSLRSRTPQNFFGDNHFCGGVIISPLFVLTAAHCVMDNRKIMFSSRVLLVVVGTPNRLRHILKQTLNMPVQKIFVPTNFTVHNTNNLAMIKLNKKLPVNKKNIGFIDLPTAEPAVGQDYRVMGWGRVYKGGPLASRILYIDVKLQEKDVCKQHILAFSSEMMCAANFNELDESPCTGDSGDPLMLDTTLYGIVTYGLGCGNPKMPSVYTNVWYHIDWIKETMEKNGIQSCMHISWLCMLLSGLLILFT